MTPTRARFAEVVRSEPLDLGLACLLVGGEVEPDLDVDLPLALLDAHAAAVRPLLPDRWDARAVAGALRTVLGERAGYAGTAADYEHVDGSLLHRVLPSRHGLPLLLSVVWVEVAARAGVAAHALALPGHVVVSVGDPDDDHVLVDPFSGGRVLEEPDVLARWGRPLTVEERRPARPEDLLLRLLTNVRVISARSERLLEGARTRLWAVELSLLLPRHPLGLRRERGELLVRLGDAPGGARVLEDYADAVEGVDPGEAGTVRREARLARATLN